MFFKRKSDTSAVAPPSSSSKDAPTDTYLLPRSPTTGEPLPPTPQPGYYAGYSTLSQQKFWDKATRDLVVNRVNDPPPIRHFTPDQATFWRAVFDHLIPQSDRTPDKRVPLLEPLDQRLFENRTSGYRYSDMPQDREAYRLGEIALNAEARQRFGGDFLTLPMRQRDLVLEAIHDGKPTAAPEIWKHMSVERFWQYILQDAISSYYAHPWSWDEIGFGGPAYPRAYTRLERGEPEPWEVEETRYDWLDPDYTVSFKVDNTLNDDDETQSHHGSGGTH